MKKESSIAKRLIFKLNTTFSLIFLAISVITFFVAQREVNNLFDAELKKSSIIFFEISKNINSQTNHENLEDILHQKFFNRYDYEIIVQIWKNSELLYSSNREINFPFPLNEGFSNIKNSQKNWREFVFYDNLNNFKIAIYENYQIRRNLILEITSSVFLIIFISSFFIIGSVIKIVNIELRPIGRFSNQLKTLSLNEFSIISIKEYPQEIQPLISSFNDLMIKLQSILENEKKFTNYAAHELNTPLTAIKLQVEVLKNNFKSNQPLNFKQIITAVDRASHLINQILILSRIEGEVDDANFKKNDLKEIIEETLSDFNGIDKKLNKISVKYHPKNTQMIFKLHNVFFKILLKNLIDNALKYSLDNNPIELNITYSKENLTLEIINNSENISPEDQSKIFNKFFRANKSSRTKDIQGCGLGLNIVKKIADIHNAKIYFKNFANKTIVGLILKN